MTTRNPESCAIETTNLDAELRRFGDLVSAVERLRRRLRRFANKLPDSDPGSILEILRSRIDCVLHDEMEPAVRDLESARAEALKEAAE